MNRPQCCSASGSPPPSPRSVPIGSGNESTTDLYARAVRGLAVHPLRTSVFLFQLLLYVGEFLVHFLQL